jgi:hypothetical protein
MADWCPRAHCFPSSSALGWSGISMTSYLEEISVLRGVCLRMAVFVRIALCGPGFHTYLRDQVKRRHQHCLGTAAIS